MQTIKQFMIQDITQVNTSSLDIYQQTMTLALLVQRHCNIVIMIFLSVRLLPYSKRRTFKNNL